ncbi:TetR/AcrR family transcriptional regulator [Jiangella alkaliphila]|uniref:DNA-binding transcriptional regulator, AcrR family n=1 Tax=Jiangella alkaliphila TaxID=419479 RepID=A0A1H2JI96_9ACTN|nr:TetR/AcrR family transcriptional regulator [Jiangella alkaliphila]SDU55848.1 DNA-binding transcriptional regulator, AcrR family [Jiangella alkaliphila]
MAQRQPGVLTPAGQRLLDTASALFYRHGIRAVGVDAIAAAAGTTKKTLYDRFGSKDALVALYLRRRFERWSAFLAGYLDEHAPRPGPDRVLAVFDALAEWQRDAERGCAFVNAYAEIGGTDHPGVAVIRTEKETVRELYVRLVTEAGVPPAAATELGLRLALLHEGGLVTMTAGGQRDALTHARAAAADLLAAALR